ncbi:cold regulated 413 plasma membrane 1 [Salvia divinorum]|uniref:Cold regulated 413 plasma membrane 1 n=1 Tax=Salvia divinorum TaxID=28513 RepID=A0ABD1I5I1_SALDI
MRNLEGEGFRDFVAVVLRLFFPKHFPDWLEMSGSLILLLVVAPTFFSYTVRNTSEHVEGSGTRSPRAMVSPTLSVSCSYQVWALVLAIL